MPSAIIAFPSTECPRSTTSWRLGRISAGRSEGVKAHDVQARRRNARAISFLPTCLRPDGPMPPVYGHAVGRSEGLLACDADSCCRFALMQNR